MTYLYQKFEVMMGRKGVDLQSAFMEKFFTEYDEFGYDQGLNFAVAFTAYNNEREYILDKSIGELMFIAYEWGEDAETGDVFVKRERIPSHPCSKDELGLGNN